MPAKIRLQRYGKKGNAFFHIVVADGRAPRDGKFIEKLGTYNPTTNPATIEIDSDSAFEWLKKGAQPSDTCHAILKYKGVAMRYHLHKGIMKGALTQEQADAKLAKFLEEKEAKVQSKRERLSSADEAAKRKALEAEKAAKAAKEAKIAAKNAAVTEKPAESEAEAPAAEGENNG